MQQKRVRSRMVQEQTPFLTLTSQKLLISMSCMFQE